MLTYADVCTAAVRQAAEEHARRERLKLEQLRNNMQVRCNMLTYADVCSPMLTYADVC